MSAVMKKIFSKTALSLLELVIASVLVVVVILGIFAISSVLKNNNQDYGQRYLVRSETQATLNHILNNASLAIGSGTTVTVAGGTALDKGILLGDQMGLDPNGWLDHSFCIHQDIDPNKSADYTTLNIPPTSPPGYIGSRWLCYDWDPPTMEITYFTAPYNLMTDAYRGARTAVNDYNNNIAAHGLTGTFLGTAITNPFKTGLNAVISFNATSGLTITIQNCLDNTASSCFNSDPTKQDPVNNPQVTLTGSVFPSQSGVQQN